MNCLVAGCAICAPMISLLVSAGVRGGSPTPSYWSASFSACAPAATTATSAEPGPASSACSMLSNRMTVSAKNIASNSGSTPSAGRSPCRD